MEHTLDAARALAEAHDGDVCFHGVQIGSDPQGEALLRSLADTTDCGSFRPASALSTVAAYHSFEREALLGGDEPAPAPVVLARDTDADGVQDARDRCPGSPAGVRVDVRGCWVLEWLYFATDSAALDAEASRRLDREVLPVLQRNPELVLRVDGHTDSQGSADYNLRLSESRADAVRRRLVAAGIDAARVTTKGFGESQPVASNGDAEGRRKNRRTELTVVR